jgi:hypothetical protein
LKNVGTLLPFDESPLTTPLPDPDPLPDPSLPTLPEGMTLIICPLPLEFEVGVNDDCGFDAPAFGSIGS